MTETNASEPRPRGTNKPTTIANIAARKDAIAVFAYAAMPLSGHIETARHGHADRWSTIAANVAGIAAQVEDGDWTQPIRLNIGDAQTVWYVRDGAFAVVVVLAKGSTLGKSVLRMSRRALKALAAAEDLEAVKARTVADLAVARDLGSIRA